MKRNPQQDGFSRLVGFAYTASKNIDASGDITGIELKLQVSICKKEK